MADNRELQARVEQLAAGHQKVLQLLQETDRQLHQQKKETDRQKKETDGLSRELRVLSKQNVSHVTGEALQYALSKQPQTGRQSSSFSAQHIANNASLQQFASQLQTTSEDVGQLMDRCLSARNAVARFSSEEEIDVAVQDARRSFDHFDGLETELPDQFFILSNYLLLKQVYSVDGHFGWYPASPMAKKKGKK